VFNASDVAAIEQAWRQVNAYVPIWGMHRFITAQELQHIVEEAYKVTSTEYNIREAQVWAEGYSFPTALLQQSMGVFETAWRDLELFCRNRHAEMHDQRLNLDRVYSTFGEESTLVPTLLHTDFIHLCTLAEEGIQLFLPTDFIPIYERNTYWWHQHFTSCWRRRWSEV
jgi:hypothetical protein